MIRIIPIVAFLLMALAAQAQFHFGVNTAINSTFVLDKGLSEDPRYNSTMSYNYAPIGVSAGLNVGKKFGLQLETILSNQGQIYEIVDAANKVVGERNIDLSYLQIPLLFKFMNGSDRSARANFSFGPQLSILNKGFETLQYDQSVMKVPAKYATDNGDGTYTITDPSTNQVLTNEATFNEDGTYNMPTMSPTQLLSSEANNELQRLREAEFQLAASMGLDIDMGKHLYLSSVIRANYSLTDMRNGDVIDMINEQGFNSLFDKRANLLIGIQLSLNYIIGGTRSFTKEAPTEVR